jgi:hypothetical protein
MRLHFPAAITQRVLATFRLSDFVADRARLHGLEGHDVWPLIKVQSNDKLKVAF